MAQNGYPKPKSQVRVRKIIDSGEFRMSGSNSRRQFLAAVGISAATAIAGCLDDDSSDDRGGPGNGHHHEDETDDHHRDDENETDNHHRNDDDMGDHHRDDDMHHRRDRLDPVPAAYETATAIDGTVRDPNSLASKAAVNYQSVSEASEQCAGCRYYIPDKDGDSLGACAVVAGRIEPDGWCTSFISTDSQ